MVKFTHPIKTKPKGDISLIYSFDEDEIFFAPYDGVISKISDDRCGKKVEITHSIDNKEYKSILCNVQNISVNPGDKVRKNEPIGKAFETGKLTFEVTDDGKKINPKKLIDSQYYDRDSRKKFKDITSMKDLAQNIAELPLNLFRLPTSMITKSSNKNLKEEIDRIKSLL